MMPTQPSVLIVGAGPTGLMMAYLLARYGISFRIIDKKSQATQTSNATTLQTRTLEIFTQLGIVDDFLQAGHRCESIHFHHQNKEFTQVNFNHLDSIYPYIYALSQAHTEAILEKRLNDLGCVVERETELLSVQENAYGGYNITVAKVNGPQDFVDCQYLLGCDGAHSVVRQHCGFHFAGNSFKEKFFIVDSVIQNFLTPGQSHVFTDNGGMLMAFPLGQQSYQLSGNLPIMRHAYNDTDIKQIVAKRSSAKISADNISWMSSFNIHCRVTPKLRKANIFLLGDAAHIHSPTGGQGMNLGIQDAHNLAWKLALVLTGKAKPQLLESYHSERYPVIKSVIATTKFFTKILMMTQPLVVATLKNIAKYSLSVPFIHRIVARRFAQLDICYTSGVAVQRKLPFRRSLLGKRSTLPLIYANTLRHQVLIFAGEMNPESVMTHYQAIRASLSTWIDVITIRIVSAQSLAEDSQHIHDADFAIHRAHRIKQRAVMVIRPDGYIAYESGTLKAEPLLTFFNSYLQEANHVTP